MGRHQPNPVSLWELDVFIFRFCFTLIRCVSPTRQSTVKVIEHRLLASENESGSSWPNLNLQFQLNSVRIHGDVYFWLNSFLIPIPFILPKWRKNKKQLMITNIFSVDVCFCWCIARSKRLSIYLHYQCWLFAFSAVTTAYNIPV